MLYPLKFEPLYKNYIWGGRNLEKLGKKLPPEGIVAESWEVSCHRDGTSIISNGEYKGFPLEHLVKTQGPELLGKALHTACAGRFPLLVKLIDANEDLSVQVHPDDSYARLHEKNESGKNEMWYIISSEPGARLIYDLIPGTTKEDFSRALKNGNVESCLKFVNVFAGDVINIPAGLVHAIGKGIVLAEVQQNSNATYRVYDYNRTDKEGKKRPLHIEKALDVIDFNIKGHKEKYGGLKISAGAGLSKTYLAANRYFSAELYEIDGKIRETADGSRFFIYTFLSGTGRINYNSGSVDVAMGESVLAPAALGSYEIEGRLQALKSYVPDLWHDVLEPLKAAGLEEGFIEENVGGLAEEKNIS